MNLTFMPRIKKHQSNYLSLTNSFDRGDHGNFLIYLMHNKLVK